MLIPRYTIRSLLIATAVAAVYSLIASFAVRGRPWAVGLAAAGGVAALVGATHLGLFALANVIVSLRKALRQPDRGSSPFASGGLPRQIIAPADPD